MHSEKLRIKRRSLAPDGSVFVEGESTYGTTQWYRHEAIGHGFNTEDFDEIDWMALEVALVYERTRKEKLHHVYRAISRKKPKKSHTWRYFRSAAKFIIEFGYSPEKFIEAQFVELKDFGKVSFPDPKHIGSEGAYERMERYLFKSNRGDFDDQRELNIANLIRGGNTDESIAERGIKALLRLEKESGLSRIEILTNKTFRGYFDERFIEAALNVLRKRGDK